MPVAIRLSHGNFVSFASNAFYLEAITEILDAEHNIQKANESTDEVPHYRSGYAHQRKHTRHIRLTEYTTWINFNGILDVKPDAVR